MLYYIKEFFIYLFKTTSITYLSYILLELLDVEHGSSLSHKNVKCNSPCLVLAIEPSPPGEFFTLCFPNNTLYEPQNETCKPSESGSVRV